MRGRGAQARGADPLPVSAGAMRRRRFYYKHERIKCLENPSRETLESISLHSLGGSRKLLPKVGKGLSNPKRRSASSGKLAFTWTSGFPGQSYGQVGVFLSGNNVVFFAMFLSICMLFLYALSASLLVQPPQGLDFFVMKPS